MNPSGVMKNKVSCILFILIAFHALRGAGQEIAVDREPHGRAKNTKRAFIEIGSFMAISTVNYWIKYTKFIEDWQFRLNWKDQRKRFTTGEGWRLDSNSFKSNWTHALSGAVYYSMARSNRLSWLESSLFSLGGSAFWELISEWREIISINDMFFTPWGGPAIGETLFQLGSHFMNRRGIVNQLVGALFNPIVALNRLLDGKRGVQDRDSGGPGWRQFECSFGMQQGESPLDGRSYSRTNLGLQMQLVPFPEYGRPGRQSKFLHDPLYISLDFNISFGSREMEEFRARSKAILFGYWKQNQTLDPAGELEGSALLLGVGSAFDIFKRKALVPYDASSGALSNPRYPRECPTLFNDKLAVISLVGPVLDVAVLRRGWRIHWNTDAFFDFALINSLPLNAYSEQHDLLSAKTTVLSWGYYYGFGFTLSSSAAINSGKWQWQSAVKYQAYRSLQGLDRFQDIVTDDFRLHDEFLTMSASIGFRPGRGRSMLRLGVENIGRRGRIHDFTRKTRETRWYGQLSFGF